MEAISPIINAYEGGASALLLTGRHLSDFDLDGEGTILTLHEGLRRRLRALGLVLIEYNQANGLRWHDTHIEDERDRGTIEEVLETHQLADIPQDEHEVARIMRGLSSLLRTPTDGLEWADGTPMRFAVLTTFSEHLVPEVSSGMHTDLQVVAVQVASTLGSSLALRDSNNLLMLRGQGEQIDTQVQDQLLEVRLPQPDAEEKRPFLSAVHQLYTEAELEEGLTINHISNLVGDTPNRSQEALFRAAHYNDESVCASDLAERKARDIESLSEGTLTLMNQRNVENLVGASVARPQSILNKCAVGLRNSDSTMPANIVLIGPPGTGKSVMTLNLARTAGVPAFEMQTPKNSLVGETERLARLQRRILGDFTPHVVFVDEITEALPMERSSFDGDSGASRAVGASLLQVLGDEDRRGESLLVGTTNCPWRFGAAMLKRFTCIPVLFPVKSDYPGILIETVQRVAPELDLQAEDPRIQQSADLFYAKKASARDMRAALSNTALLSSRLDVDNIVQAAHNYAGRTNKASVIYAELWAIKATKSKDFFPWHDDPAGFPFPRHLNGIVDPDTGEIDHEELNERIEKYEPLANV